MQAKNSVRRSLLARTSLFATAVVLSCAASAQVTSTNPSTNAAPASAPANQQAIVITGSAVPTPPDKVAVPVTVINSAQIQKAGVATNVLEILRKQVPSFGGRSSTGNSNATNNNQRTAGGSSIQVRNLDTLILVNGRRIAPSAISGINGKIFVNVNEIPPDAIDHIEVLTDGASAIYGSEAVGGVVNIILKSNWHGGQVNVRYGGADGYNERSLGLTYGANVLPNTNVTVAASYSKSDPLFQKSATFLVSILFDRNCRPRIDRQFLPGSGHHEFRLWAEVMLGLRTIRSISTPAQR